MRLLKKNVDVKSTEEKLKSAYLLKKTLIEFRKMSFEKQDNLLKEFDDYISCLEKELERNK